ncbi:PhnD/SsuA/transferrin family substrate-binding protein [Mesorhizobium sp. SB112]|uniref:phosphate/phosphite/phosphonate ABC transporter substrate-binding protein n=1 Tax=Mesorhizobium sp. SB112 TaxID=3151853 RepID=UPI0032636888
MTKFIAALPMYDWPETRAETDAQWVILREAFREAGIDVPENLTRDFELSALWRHPDLLFAQTCWGPMEQGLADEVQFVAQPSYDTFEGGQGEFYSSAIVMRRGLMGAPPSVLPDISPSRGEISSCEVGDCLISPLEGEMAGKPEGGGYKRNLQSSDNGKAPIPLDLLRGKRFTYNGPDSMSGIIALTRDLEALGESIDIFSERTQSGGHRASIVAVAEGRADVAAIDCRSWAMAQTYEKAAEGVEVVGWTARRKGLPFITSRKTPSEIIEKMRDALKSLNT